MDQNQIGRMKELITRLNEASMAYYANDEEIISNYEYDKLYDELEELEKTSGIVLSNSPTGQVGYQAVDFLPKEKHDRPMLSLSKTKEREELVSWIGEKEGLLSWKLDGLTVVLTYENGEMIKAVTRGNGEVGEVITANAKTFINVPLRINYQKKLVVRGEAVISYDDFEVINQKIENPDERYKNPRNLCSGSVRQLNSEVTASRNVRIIIFGLVSMQDDEFETREQQYQFLSSLGFDVVEHIKVTSENLRESIDVFAHMIETNPIPSDGLVLCYNNIAYGRSLGMTAKFPRDAIAFKWKDETAHTILREVEWSPSRTGLINPVAVFDPVELEGTTVSRASVHNVSVMESLKLGIGDEITVYKANMIIPQIAENLTKSGQIIIPKLCPACHQITQIRDINEGKTLFCPNIMCPAKMIKRYAHFVSRDAFNVDGLSEATLEKLIAKGFINEYSDLFHLSQYREQIIVMEGFGQKSYQNLIDSIENAKKIVLPKLIYALGIDNVGLANAKLICKNVGNTINEVRNANREQLSQISGVGDVIANSFVSYFENDSNNREIDHLLDNVVIETGENKLTQTKLSGMVCVITGSLNRYENRNLLKDEIERRGGKVTSGVTGKTDLLINNDILSNSSKNKSAKELGVRIINEDDFINEFINA